MQLALSGSIVAALLLVPPSTALAPREVQVQEGRLEGTCDDVGVCRFLGIPYAAPPLGELRWKPPQPAPTWTGLRAARRFGSQCLQPGELVGYKDFVGAESCLFLNVWAPKASQCTGASCAVMFWIHGGAYITGSGELDASNLVDLAKNVVVVSINYRLNIFGFLGSDVLRGRDVESGSTGNYGIQDQRAAMAWVRLNIHQFGGDASNVMIFGQSAGGGSVSMHLTMQRSWPLYHKAAIESGAYSYWSAQPMEEAELQYKDVLLATGCGPQQGLPCLLAMDGMGLVNHMPHLPLRPRPYGSPWAPTVDGVELEMLPWELRDKGRFNTGVPVLLGYNKDEGTIVGVGTKPQTKIYEKASDMTAGDFARLVTKEQYNVSLARLADVLDVYSVNAPGGDPDYTSWYWAATHFNGDYTFSCPSRQTGRAISKFSSHPPYMYYFAHTPRMNPLPGAAGASGTNDTYGATHTAELLFVFIVEDDQFFGGPRLVGSDELLLARTIASYWVNFARSSNPNLPGSGGTVTGTNLTMAWKPFAAPHEASLRLDLPQLSSLDGRNNRQCDLMDSLGVLISPPLELAQRRAPQTLLMV